MQFRFDVSLRNEEAGSGIGLYLTYKGSGPSIRPANVARIPRADSTETIPLLVDTTLTKSGDNEVDSRSVFESEKTGCGLIDLQKYGVRPLKDQDLSGIKTALKNFGVTDSGRVVLDLNGANRRGNLNGWKASGLPWHQQ